MMPHAYVIVRIVPTGGRAGIVRAFVLTPYDLELLTSEVHHYGPGTRLDVLVGGDRADLADVTTALAAIEARGVDVSVSLAAPRTHRATSKEDTHVPSMSYGR
jgi:alpha-glucuronidase